MTKVSETHHVTKQGTVKKNPRKVNLYLQMSRKHQKDFDKFPMFFAFNEEQLAEGMRKLGVKDKSELRSLGMGGIVKKDDVKKYYDMIIRHGKEMNEKMKNKTVVYQAFRYELANHEFVCTGDYDDTLRSLGLTMEKIEKNPMWKEQLRKATDDYMSKAEC